MSKHLRIPQDVVLQSWFTERTTALQDHGRYTFRVHPKANKHQIRDAVEKIFNVKVDRVNVLSVPGKLRRVRIQVGRTPSWKKAVIKLKKGYTIEF